MIKQWKAPARREVCQDRGLDYGKKLKMVSQETVQVKAVEP